MKKVNFYNADRTFSLPIKRLLQRFIEELFCLEQYFLEKIDYIFCSDEYLLHINKTFLQHDYYTDIITFNLSDSKAKVVGEVYISLDRVKENARGLNIRYGVEELRVIIHGALHLCGYKDKTKKEIAEMRQKEDYYLAFFAQKYKQLI